jgi:hypothetical protein
MNEIKARQQTKLLQNNGTESLKGGQGYSTIVAWCGMAWCGVAPCGMRRGVARRGVDKEIGESERNRARWRVCGVRGRVWRCVLAAGSLEAFECSGGMVWVRLCVDVAVVVVRTRAHFGSELEA